MIFQALGELIAWGIGEMARGLVAVYRWCFGEHEG